MGTCLLLPLKTPPRRRRAEFVEQYARACDTHGHDPKRDHREQYARAREGDRHKQRPEKGGGNSGVRDAPKITV